MAFATIGTTGIADDAVTSAKVAPGVVDTEAQPNQAPIIINGDCAVAQRNTSVASLTSSGDIQTVDRIKNEITNIGTYTVIQESLTSGEAYNNGFRKAWRIDCTSADASPAAGDNLYVTYSFEGQDLQLFKKGTSNAEKFTLAFWIKSNKTGTGQVNLRDNDNSRLIGGTYTISSADTWEHKVVNFAADTNGALDNDNNGSMDIEWWLDSGTNYSSGTTPTAWEAFSQADRNASGTLDIADNTANDWAITGIQLEVGEFTSSTIPPFKHESFGTNMARCQRYFTMIADGRLGGGSNEAVIGSGYCHSGNTSYFACGTLPVRMRGYDPSIFTVTGTGNYKALRDDGEDYFNTLVMYGQYNEQMFSVNGTGGVSATQGQGIQMRLGTSITYLGVDSEL